MFTFINQKKIMVLGTNTLLRPQLKCCVWHWSPGYRKGAITLEKVQRRLSIILPGLEGFSSEERLAGLCLLS